MWHPSSRALLKAKFSWQNIFDRGIRPIEVHCSDLRIREWKLFQEMFKRWSLVWARPASSLFIQAINISYPEASEPASELSLRACIGTKCFCHVLLDRAHCGLSANNKRWLLATEISLWRKDKGLLTDSSLTEDLQIYESANVDSMMPPKCDRIWYWHIICERHLITPNFIRVRRKGMVPLASDHSGVANIPGYNPVWYLTGSQNSYADRRNKFYNLAQKRTKRDLNLNWREIKRRLNEDRIRIELCHIMSRLLW
jgi:hypothetical protein